MRFILVGITNGSTKVYHIANVKENGEEKFIEMRRTKYAKKLYLQICNTNKNQY